MKTTIAVVFVLLLVWRGAADVRAHYQYSNSIGSYWDLSVKASTLTMKADYLDRFVAAVDSARLSGHNAIFFPTPDNDVGQNVATLKSLQHRMAEIRSMDVTSFAYQQAISQITAQEQGEADKLLGVIEGAWFLNHHFLFWDWIDVVVYLLLLAPIAVVAFVALADF